MSAERPDLNQLDLNVRRYIEYLESELERVRSGSRRPARAASHTQAADDDRLDDLPELTEPAEPPTTTGVIMLNAGGLARRTQRHLYQRQRRGGMGALDIENATDPATDLLTQAEESQTLLLISAQGRAYRAPVSAINLDAPRGVLQPFLGKVTLAEGDSIAAVLTEQAEGHVAMVSRTGKVRLLRHHVFGAHMKAGQELFKYMDFGLLGAACWTPGNSDLFIASRQGKAIRFSDKLIPPAGGPGIRLTDGDEAVGIAPVTDDSGIFLLSADGRGTIRLMQTFGANKAPGAGGKAAINNDQIVTALSTTDKQDAFILSRQGKLIRFRLDEIPAKDGNVQGVILMSLRADEPIAALLV